MVMIKACVAGVVALCVLHSSDGWSAPSDAALRKALLGDWGLSREHSTPEERKQFFHLFTGFEEFHADGTGAANLYWGQCGKLIVSLRFTWTIENGILVSKGTVFNIPRVTRDRIVSVDRETLTLFSLDKQKTEYRGKAANCTMS